MPKKTSFFAICLIILSVAVCISLADLFSSILTIGNFAFLQVQAVKVNAYKIYALSIDDATTKNEAQEKAITVKQKGGAGYVYKQNNIFYVLASAYENENDCKKVQDQIKQNELNSKIIVIDIPQIVIDTNFSQTEKTSLVNALNAFKTVYKNVYDLSISLDTSVKNLPECKLEVYNLKSNIQQIYDNFGVNFNQKINNELLNIKIKLTSLINLVQNLINNDKIQDKIVYSCLLKTASIESIVLNQELAESFSK